MFIYNLIHRVLLHFLKVYMHYFNQSSGFFCAYNHTYWSFYYLKPWFHVFYPFWVHIHQWLYWSCNGRSSLPIYFCVYGIKTLSFVIFETGLKVIFDALLKLVSRWNKNNLAGWNSNNLEMVTVIYDIRIWRKYDCISLILKF